MKAEDRRRIGDLIALQRRWIEIDPLETYQEIGVRSFGKGIFHKEPVTGDLLGNKRVLRIEPGDLVLNNVFAWEGAVAIASSAEENKFGSHRFLTYTARNGEVDPAYLRYFLVSEEGIRLLSQASPGSAGRNRTLAIDRFEALEIPLPDLTEQRRIAAWLRDFGEKAKRLSQVAKGDEPLALTAAPGIIDSLIGRHATEPRRVGEVVALVNDLVRPGDDPAPAETFVGLQHVESHTGRRIGEVALGNEKGRKFRFAPGDIVYGYLRPYLNKVWLADRHGLCSVDQYVLRASGKLPAEYIAYALRSRSILDEAIRLTHSLQLPRLRSGLLLDLQIRIPEGVRVTEVLEQLERANARVIDLDAALRSRRQRVEALEASALNHAFSGLV